MIPILLLVETCPFMPIAPSSPVTEVTVVADSASLTAGSETDVVATLRDANGTILDDRSVLWSTSDTAVATVLASGPTSALVTARAAGPATVTAVAEGKSGTADISVSAQTGGTGSDSTSSGDQSANEPAGYVRFAEHTFEAIPLVGPPGVCTQLGILDGCWFRYDPAGNYALAAALDAALTSPGVLRIRFPTGLAPGASPGLFQGWDTGSETNSTQYGAIYETGRIRVPTPDFELQAVGVKFLGYVGAGRAGQGIIPAQVYFFSDNPAHPSTSVQTAVKIAVLQQGHVDRRMGQNRVSEPVFTFGTWHRYEYLMTLNDIGVANGTVRVWWDGTLILEYTDVVFRDSANPSGFYGRRWDPIWGGGGGSQHSRDDYLEIDHLYISGVPMP